MLVQPPVRDFYLTLKRTFPYGLASIGAALSKEGFPVRLFDSLATSKSRVVMLPSELSYLGRFYGRPDISPFALFHHFRRFGYSAQHLRKVATESKAVVVGISSLFTAYSQEALEVAAEIKNALPECLVVIGGHHATEMTNNVLDCKDVDIVVRGEGEESFPLLVEKLFRGDCIDDVPGIAYRGEGCRTVVNVPAVIGEPEGFPLPDLRLINKKWYRRGKKGTVAVVASRGCPMKCSYCSIAGSNAPYRKKSVGKVMEEIRQAVESMDAGFIDFEDENISLDRKWFRQLLQGIVELYGPGELELRAMNGLFPPSLDEEIIGLMKKAGFRALNLSLGSSCQERLKRFRRANVAGDLDRVLAAAVKNGLEAVCYIIAGAPGQTAMESLEDLLYLAKRPVLVGLSWYYPAPGSADYRCLEKKGLLPEHFSMMRSSAIPCVGETSRLEAVTLLRLSRILNFMKRFAARGELLPGPKRHIEISEREVLDREAVGKRLLSRFFFDGCIGGVTPDGQVYEHEIAKPLTDSFLKKIGSVHLR